MLNSIVLVGRIVSDPQINETENDRKATVTLAVSRSFKNMNGEYETDFIPIVLWKGIATSVIDYCKKGDVIGVRGRIQMTDNTIQLIAEKVSFLSSKKED